MRILSLYTILVLGLLIAAVSGYYLLQDWAALHDAYARFEQAASNPMDLTSLLVAEARQGIHRVNCFAEGMAVLMGVIISAVGVHGLSIRSGAIKQDA